MTDLINYFLTVFIISLFPAWKICKVHKPVLSNICVFQEDLKLVRRPESLETAAVLFMTLKGIFELNFSAK